MNWLSLVTAAAKLVAAVMKFFEDQQLIGAGRAEGRAESKAAHAEAAKQAGDEMQKIFDKPTATTEINTRLEKGEA